MIIIGIHRGHGASCAIMVNGEIKYASQEERFSKIKNDIGFPFQALSYGLQLLKISPSDVDLFVYTTKYFPAIFTKSKHRILFSQDDYIKYYLSEGHRSKEEYFNFLKSLRDDKRFNSHEQYYNFDFLTDDVLKNPELERKLWTEEQVNYIIRTFGVSKDRVIFSDHHTCHAYYGYFSGTLKENRTAILTLDGGGDGRNQTLWLVDSGKVDLVSESKTANLAKIYKFITLLMGLRPDEDEHKVMGMAPYSKTESVQKLQHIFEHLIKIDGVKIVENNQEDNILKYLQKEFEFSRFDNIAGSIQYFTEKILSDLVINICKEYNLSSLVFSGGVALNIKVNKILSELDCINEFYVPASPGDETLSIGACYLANRGGAPLKNMYLGLDADSTEITIKNLKYKYQIIDKISAYKIAKLLASGKIIARISGKSEFGARALGNRSILAHPGITGIRDSINRQIKKRDFWMPFALSILEDHKTLLVDDNKKTNGKFMTVGFQAKQKVLNKIHEGIHPFDYTTRPQFVSKKDNPTYYEIINEFFKITKIPAILNTSFNLHRIPICNDINDAILCLENSGLEYILFGSKLIIKNK